LRVIYIIFFADTYLRKQDVNLKRIANRPEILSPVGDKERLEAAVRYGADAVYLGGKRFGMRSRPDNFDVDGLREAADYCHRHGVRLYVTLNVLPYNSEIEEIGEYIRYLAGIGADAVIVTDIGVLRLAKRLCPGLEVHISTQMGVVNWLAARELYELGASRVILARELSIPDIAVIREKTPPGLAIEAFVHGAMCVSFSGRCLISNYLTGRDSNHGECAQPCRWSWSLVEEKRPGEYFPIAEEDGGTFFFNAKDMCMLPYLDQLAAAGVSSFKIEGRAKSAYYTAVTTNAYRTAAGLLDSPGGYCPPPWLLEEPAKVSHREYCTGFYFPDCPPGQFYDKTGYVKEWKVVAVAEGWEDGMLTCTQRNYFTPGETLEALEPGKPPYVFTAGRILGEDGAETDAARHPMELLRIPCGRPLAKGTFLRRETARG
jgi:putative protease